MRILKLKRLESNIYLLTYVNFFGITRSKKVYNYSIKWRFLESGKVLKSNSTNALGALADGLKIGESRLTGVN